MCVGRMGGGSHGQGAAGEPGHGGLRCLFPTAGLFMGWSFWILVWVWGFFVVADSAQFSALVTEVAPSEAVGTALTLQTSMGFLLTMVTIQGLPLLIDGLGWSGGFPFLALGPALGIWAMLRLSRLRSRAEPPAWASSRPPP